MKRLLVTLAIVLVLVAGFCFGRPLYRGWKQDRLVVQARESLRKGDLRSAGLSARQALKINAGNVEACRIMADIVESFRLPEALEWRQKVMDLEPGSLTNHLEFARCAIQQGEYVRAAKALQGVARTNQNSSAFHQMAAMAAIGLKQIGEAEAHFSEALRLEPGNKRLELNLAIIHLQATNQDVVAGALKSLQALDSDPTNRIHALRHLALTASREKDFTRAAVFTRELQADPQAGFNDRLMHLTSLKEGRLPEFDGYLKGMKTASATNGETAAGLASWMMGHGQSDEAVRWLGSLPTEVQQQTPVRLAHAESLTAQKDWIGLQTLLQSNKWDEVDFLRQAMLARAYREQKQDFTAQTEWRGAVRSASVNARQLSVLVRTARQWNWNSEREDVLWVVVDRFPGERWAMESLSELYLADGNTRGLYKIYSKLVEFNADDFAAKNNLAAVSLLLNLQPQRAHELAHEAWQKSTNNASFASTYAWSLHLQGRTAEGIKVLETLNPERLKIPGVALYYGLLEAAISESAKAKMYLDLAASGPLLPEERALLATARRGL